MAISSPNQVTIGPMLVGLDTEIGVGEMTEYVMVVLDIRMKLPPLVFLLDCFHASRNIGVFIPHRIHSKALFEEPTALPPKEVYFGLIRDCYEYFQYLQIHGRGAIELSKDGR